jgi:hypothetical protein
MADKKKFEVGTKIQQTKYIKEFTLESYQKQILSITSSIEKFSEVSYNTRLCL